MNDMKKITVIILIVLIGLSLDSCKKEEEITIRSYWQFVSLEKNNIQPPQFLYISDTLEINTLFGPMGFLNINSYCNTGTGNYSVQGASLTISNLSMTEIHCYTNEPIDWEAVFVYNLELSEYYLIEDKELTILTGGDYHLHFKIKDSK